MSRASLRATGPIVQTREQWLRAATQSLGAHFFPVCDSPLPEKLSCSCGFPYKSREAIGQCWGPKAATDGTTHMFISPCQAEPVRVLDILLHEMIHAAIGTEEGHGKKFKAAMRAVGLEGKATATIANPGTELHARLTRIAEELGPYPHSALRKDLGEKKKKEKKAGGWIRLVSPECEEYKVVISPKQLEEHGAPTDPWGNEMEVVS
jgi:hypothetical protein